jgi:hypothetical protein
MDLVEQVTPVHGPWDDIIDHLRGCDVAFIVGECGNQKNGNNPNCIACVAHMIRDPLVRAILIALHAPENNTARTRTAELDQQKATSTSKSHAAYNTIFQNYLVWQKDYIKSTFNWGLGIGFFEVRATICCIP